MEKRSVRWPLVPLAATLLASCGPSFSQSPNATTFTYQGALKENGSPVSGAYDLQFILYNSPVGGNQVGPILAREDQPLAGGLIRAELDFGAVFDGSDRWLEVGVRPGAAAGSFTPLVPRQRLAAVPYASFSFLAGSLPWAGLTGIPAGFADGADNDTLFTAGAGLTLTAGKFDVAFGGNGAAATAARSDHHHNTLYAPLTHAHAWSTITGIPAGIADGVDSDTTYTAGAGLTLTGTAFGVAFGGTGAAATASRSDHGHTFIGTTNKLPAQIIVNSASVFRLAPAETVGAFSGPINLIGGAPQNNVTAGIVGATIAGGGGSIEGQGDFYNRVTDHYGTVGGGIGNTAGDGNETLDDHVLATVAGGSVNSARSYGFVGGGYSNSTLSLAGVVAGGWDNTANGQYNTIGGGTGNVTNGNYSFVGGGQNNTASGSWSAVLGGANNVASAITAIALGTDAHANHSGTLVFGDGSGPAVSSTTFEQITMRAANGYRFFTNPGMTAGVSLAPGAGGWSNISDVNVKTAFSPVDSLELLKKLAAIPIQSWQYKSQDSSVRHIGPTAQDFRAAFGMGEDDKHINSVDGDGVALAAIQGLYRMVRERDDRIRALRAQNERQDRRIKDLEARMSALEKWMERHP